MKNRSIAMVCGLLCCASLTLAQAATTVKKTAEAFDGPVWDMSPWNAGAGQALLSDDVAPGVGSKKSMEFQVKFSGKGFEPTTAVVRQPLVIPGDAKTVTIRAKRGDGRYGLKIGFRDGWGRDNASGQALEWWLPFAPESSWQTFTFKIPDNWVRPISIESLVTHNWDSQAVEGTARFWLDQLEVETDIASVDPATGVLKTWKPEPNPADPAKALKQPPVSPLLSVGFTTGVECNVFTTEVPQVTLQIQNWKPGTLTGQGTCQVFDESGKAVDNKEIKVSVDSAGAYVVPLAVPGFGRYTLKASLDLSDGSKRSQQMVFAKLPVQKELTEAQKMASPYGVNAHSAVRMVITPFQKAGIVWFRDYSFEYEWMVRARGADGRYAGWPYYPKIMKAYADAGVKVLPILQRSMPTPVVKDGKVVSPIGPDEDWQREIACIILAFPQIKYWELNNEYDVNAENTKAEDLIGWANYRAYHKQFGEILSILSGGKKIAVENGQGRVWAVRDQAAIKSGDFDKIGVLNSHHYCGTDAPELNCINFNTNFDTTAQRIGSIADQLRDIKQVAQSDGKKRQSWWTEFGWDTLAGPIVTPYEQAVYLPRAYMLAMASGTDKAFWYWNQFDAADPKTFFDGCPVLSPTGEPKLGLSSMAGLISILPTPHYVGSLNAGDNTWGYMFENDGKLVASLWTLKGDQGPTVKFSAGQLYDYFGNKLTGDSAKLTMAPVYAVGVDKNDLWYKQTAYSLTSQELTPVVAGDTATPVLAVQNNRSEPIDFKVTLVLPDGCKADKTESSATVAPGAKLEVPMPISVSVLEGQGTKDAKFIVSEGKKLKELPFRLLVQPAMTLEVAAIAGRPGPASFIAKVSNFSQKSQNATLRIKTPASWKTATPTIQLADLKPGERRETKVDLTWSAQWAPGETALVELDAGDGKPLAKPLIPNQYRIHPATGIKLDGDLADWSAGNELPNWMLGSTYGASRAKIYFAWAKEGLYGAVEVHDSKARAKDPKNFWTGDVMELFLDARDNKTAREYGPGDHQFWFVPMVDQNRVYVGQWKRNAEIADTLYDVQGIQSAAKKTADGYVMEFLLPAGLIKQYQPAAGNKIGLNLNLNVHGQVNEREVYWPKQKQEGAPAHPESWGTLELAN